MYVATCSSSSSSSKSEDEEAEPIGEANIETLKTLITKQSMRQMVMGMEKKEKSAKRKQLHAAAKEKLTRLTS
jgi:hypothetical protein